MAIDLVRFRGEVMQAAVPKDQGAMAAILGLEDADVVAGCAEAEQGEVVEAANFNSPGQVVIAGMRTAVERASELLKAKGAKRTIMLPVSVPSHTSLMKPAAEHLAERLKSLSIAIPQVPIFTIDLGVHSSPDGIRAALCEQLVKSVRWTDTVRAISQTGVKSIVECGPGKVLTGLNRSIERRIKRDKSISMLAIDDPASLQEALLLTQGK
jgi:[acyl-carrier-protein] S-malonyltransferase